MKVTVGFCTSEWWVSRLIRWCTRATVSHAFLLIDGVPGFPQLAAQAEWDGWKLTTRAAVTKGGTRIVAVVNPKVALEGALIDSLAWVDTRYNYTGLLGMAWVSLGRWLGKKWRNPLRGAHSMFCSEAVVDVLDDAGYPGASDLDPDSTSPEDLLEFLKRTGSAEIAVT